jgi:hypothetical protein
MSPRFDIFSGTQFTARWLETAESLNKAVSRMEQRAQAEPGPYFVYDSSEHTVVASIDQEVADSER